MVPNLSFTPPSPPPPLQVALKLNRFFRLSYPPSLLPPLPRFILITDAALCAGSRSEPLSLYKTSLLTFTPPPLPPLHYFQVALELNRRPALRAAAAVYAAALHTALLVSAI